MSASMAEHGSTMAEFKGLYLSGPEQLDDLRHLRANYERHTQTIGFVFRPMSLFEEQKH